MFSFKIKTIDPQNIKKQLNDLPQRLEQIRAAIGNDIADNIKKDVQRRIPKGAAWLEIYRKAIDFSSNGKVWAVAGEAQVTNIKNVDATTTLVEFTAVDAQTTILAQYNPWAVDVIPAINKSYGGKTIFHFGISKSQVESRRTTLIHAMGQIKATLSKVGFTIDVNGLPKLNGNLTADLVYLSQRLEEGRGSAYPPTPHWKPVVTNVGAILKESIEQTKDKFKDILQNGTVVPLKPMSPGIRSLIQNAQVIRL